MSIEQYIGGGHAVEAALLADRPISKIFISAAAAERFRSLTKLAKEKRVVIQETDSRKLNELAPDLRHQGVLALSSPVAYRTIDEMLDIAASRKEDPLIIFLEGVEDPRNLGAFIRSAEGFGAHGVVIPRRGASPLTAVAAKAAAGALERLPVAQVGNLSQEMEKLKKMGVWIAGLALEGSREITEENLKGPLALVLGNEGKGLSRLVRERCDFLLRIPLTGEVGSLNVATAGAVALYEVQRQRRLVLKR